MQIPPTIFTFSRISDSVWLSLILSTAPWLASITLREKLGSENFISRHKYLEKYATAIYYTCPLLTIFIIPCMYVLSALTISTCVGGYHLLGAFKMLSNGSASFVEAFRISKSSAATAIHSININVLEPMCSTAFQIFEGPIYKLINGILALDSRSAIIGLGLVCAQILGYMALQHSISRNDDKLMSR